MTCLHRFPRRRMIIRSPYWLLCWHHDIHWTWLTSLGLFSMSRSHGDINWSSKYSGLILYLVKDHLCKASLVTVWSFFFFSLSVPFIHHLFRSLLNAIEKVNIESRMPIMAVSNPFHSINMCLLKRNTRWSCVRSIDNEGRGSSSRIHSIKIQANIVIVLLAKDWLRKESRESHCCVLSKRCV